jgi:hypothetical protein
LAAAVTFLAAISHPRGLLLLAPLLWEWARVERPWERWRRSWRDPHAWRDGLLVLGAIPAAYLAMAAISWRATGGDPLAFVHVHGDFDRVALEPWLVVRLFFGILYRSAPGSFSQAHVLSDVGAVAVIVLVIGLGVAYRRIPASFALYTMGLVALTIASPTPSLVDPFVSAGRLLIPAIPVFLLLAAWAERRPWLTWLLVGVGLSLQVVLATFFINGGWLI